MEDDDELWIHPEKKAEVIQRISSLTNKKNKTKTEQVELWVLCLIKWIETKIARIL